MSVNINENWLLVEWSEGGRDVIYIKSVLEPTIQEMKVGCQITANRGGEPQKGKLIERAGERAALDNSMKALNEVGPSKNIEEDTKDYSSSSSSWVPSDQDVSSDSEREAKKAKLDKSLRQYSNSTKGSNRRNTSTPCTKVTPVAVVPATPTTNGYQAHNLDYNELKIANFLQSLRVQRTESYLQMATPLRVKMDIDTSANFHEWFRELFRTFERVRCESSWFNKYRHTFVPPPIIEKEVVNEDAIESDHNMHDESDRSDDIVLITNKYENANNTLEKSKEEIIEEPVADKKDEKTDDKTEWVPIGSGKTLIHMDQFKKINWTSYTKATRTLLLAVFPRRVLATHSLTGKRSPAFLNKPAKLCLDPKIISDVIGEIIHRFNVKENLVRSIITTKCADECKMWRTRKVKKENKKNQENRPPKKNKSRVKVLH